ncbi:MAG: hypothetical protein R2734_03125 [Nocardioides sp.]
MKRTTSLLVSAVLMAPAVQLAASRPVRPTAARHAGRRRSGLGQAHPHRHRRGGEQGRKVWVKNGSPGGF